MKTKWKNGADSPVLLFIDDLANKWIDLNGDGIVQTEEDWGYAGLDENGAYNFLEKEILTANPEVKVTFFVPVGKRSDYIERSGYISNSFPINSSKKSRDFFRFVHNETKHELAYHGLTHGLPGNDSREFMQEWLMYKSKSEALITIREGLDIFKDVVGEYPAGGKYCGYESNGFSDDSIVESGFKWWCRYYNKGIEQRNCPISGKDKNRFTAYSIKTFGKSNVIDIPTTLPGSLATINQNGNYFKKCLKWLFKRYLIRKKLKQIDFLLDNNLIISIQEHISPSREDGIRQTPNIFDDRESLAEILKYLKKKNVWYCTGTELYDYLISKKKEL